MKVHHLGRHQIGSSDEVLNLVQVESLYELRQYEDQLVDCYKEVFSEAPYFEDYSGKEREIVESFEHFMVDGVVVFLVAQDADKNRVIGFGACERASSSEVSEFLNENLDKLEVDPTRYVYMAELAVRSPYRRRGFGALLVQYRLRTLKDNPESGFTHALMRTAKVNSNSIGIYLRLGAKIIDGLVQAKTEFGTKSNERVFLAAPLASLDLQ